MIYALLFGAGLLGGFLSGLLGIGGGLVYIFVLGEAFALFGMSEEIVHQFIIANSFFAMMFSSLAANINLIKAKEFYFKQVLFVGIFSILIATIIQELFVNTDYYKKIHFDFFLLAVVIVMLVKMFLRRRSKREDVETDQISSFKYIISGLSGGIVATLSGMGGGVITVPILHGFCRLDYKVSRSISLGVIFLTAVFITFLNLVGKAPESNIPHTYGYIVAQFSLPMVVGVLIMAPIGVKVSRKMKSSTVSLIYIIFLLLFFIKKVVELIHGLNS